MVQSHESWFAKSDSDILRLSLAFFSSMLNILCSNSFFFTTRPSCRYALKLPCASFILLSVSIFHHPVVILYAYEYYIPFYCFAYHCKFPALQHLNKIPVDRKSVV